MSEKQEEIVITGKGVSQWMLDWIKQSWNKSNLQHLSTEQRRRLIKLINKEPKD